ncbi:MAG: CrcB family protein [Mucinivorans sp.]
MKEVALVFLGSGLGGASRYAMGLLCAYLYPTASFPIATMSVNVAGSFLIGILFALPYHSMVLYMGIVGFCGGFTTFSAISGDGMAMIRAGQWWFFAIYALVTIILGVLATWCGFLLASK